MKMWVTLCIPVDVEAEEGIPITQTALDEAWELVGNPDGPPEGLVEAVSEEQPMPADNQKVIRNQVKQFLDGAITHEELANSVSVQAIAA